MDRSVVVAAAFSGTLALAGLAVFVISLDTREPLPPELIGRCKPITPLPLRVNDRPEPPTVYCPRGWMPARK